MTAALGLLYWGNGERSTYSLLTQPSAVRWGYLAGALACVGVNAGTFMYVQLYLRLVKGVHEDPELSTPWALPMASGSAILAWVLFCIAGWSVWGYFTPLVMSVETVGLVMCLHFVPPIAQYRPRSAACQKVL